MSNKKECPCGKEHIPLWDKETCINPSHNFPSHLYIQPGKSYTHTCPGCGEQQTVTAPLITC